MVDAIQRLALIRARLSPATPPIAKPKGIHCVASGEAPVTKERPLPYARIAKGIGSTFGFFQRTDERHKEWVRETDADPMVVFPEKPRHEPHHLTKIAEKWETLKRR
jgi:hypothetical protein